MAPYARLAFFVGDAGDNANTKASDSEDFLLQFFTSERIAAGGAVLKVHVGLQQQLFASFTRKAAAWNRTTAPNNT